LGISMHHVECLCRMMMAQLQPGLQNMVRPTCRYAFALVNAVICLTCMMVFAPRAERASLVVHGCAGYDCPLDTVSEQVTACVQCDTAIVRL